MFDNLPVTFGDSISKFNGSLSADVYEYNLFESKSVNISERPLNDDSWSVIRTSDTNADGLREDALKDW